MTLKQALEIVLDLANQNILDEEYTYNDQELKKEKKRQEKAVDKVYKLWEAI